MSALITQWANGMTPTIYIGCPVRVETAGEISWSDGAGAVEVTAKRHASGGLSIGTAASEKIGFYGATPIVRPTANADTSGLTLANLEIEVNQLKQLLRDVGLLTP